MCLKTCLNSLFTTLRPEVSVSGWSDLSLRNFDSVGGNPRPFGIFRQTPSTLSFRQQTQARVIKLHPSRCLIRSTKPLLAPAYFQSHSANSKSFANLRTKPKHCPIHQQVAFFTSNQTKFNQIEVEVHAALFCVASKCLNPGGFRVFCH